MNSKLVSAAVVALFAATGALAHEDYPAGDAMSLHYLSHDEGEASTQYTGEPFAQSDAMDTGWIFAEPPAQRGRGADRRARLHTGSFHQRRRHEPALDFHSVSIA